MKSGGRTAAGRSDCRSMNLGCSGRPQTRVDCCRKPRKKELRNQCYSNEGYAVDEKQEVMAGAASSVSLATRTVSFIWNYLLSGDGLMRSLIRSFSCHAPVAFVRPDRNDEEERGKEDGTQSCEWIPSPKPPLLPSKIIPIEIN